MNIHKNITELIGNTPLLYVNKLTEGLAAKIAVKLEMFNPLSSIKDRVALALIDDAEKSGKINKDTVIIEPTSGNTGIGLAYIAAQRSYKLILTMPDTMSIERRKMLKALGAEIVLTDGSKGMNGAMQKAHDLAEQHANSYIPGQFDNPANPQMHFTTTGPEIWDATDGTVDIFVSGVGTGGTLSGAGSYLKSKKAVHVVAVEPAGSSVISGKSPGPHKIQGIGAGFIPANLNTDIIDEVIAVADIDAAKTSRKLASQEGVFTGLSSGAALWAALELAKKQEHAGKLIVVILPDSGERYLSTWLLED